MRERRSIGLPAKEGTCEYWWSKTTATSWPTWPITCRSRAIPWIARRTGCPALHLAATEHYDLIVLDVMLPGIDGYACAGACAKTHGATPR